MGVYDTRRKGYGEKKGLRTELHGKFRECIVSRKSEETYRS